MENFRELGIDHRLVKAMDEMGIVKPTEVQGMVIPYLLQNEGDVIVQAQTGTGKTAAYGIPLLHRVNPKFNDVQALILCPTRELGQQISKQIFKFTKYSDKVFSEAVFGGAPIERQISALRRPTHILVATPGRLIDLIKRKAVNLSRVQTVILDEADEMLSLGFKKDLDEILVQLANVQNKWLFSATMPPGIKNIVKKHLQAQAQFFQVDKRNVVNKDIDHQFLVCEEAEKLPILLQVLNSDPQARGVIFCKTKIAAQTLNKQLQSRNIAVDAIQGDMKQIERDKVMRAFKGEKLRLLVATDLVARGIDVEGLSFVIHYQLPDKTEYYTHRSGRTARAGKKGISLSLIHSKEIKQIRFFEKTLKISFKQIRRKK